jgi:hypothetical protein
MNYGGGKPVPMLLREVGNINMTPFVDGWDLAETLGEGTYGEYENTL